MWDMPWTRSRDMSRTWHRRSAERRALGRDAGLARRGPGRRDDGTIYDVWAQNEQRMDVDPTECVRRAPESRTMLFVCRGQLWRTPL